MTDADRPTPEEVVFGLIIIGQPSGRFVDIIEGSESTNPRRGHFGDSDFRRTHPIVPSPFDGGLAHVLVQQSKEPRVEI